MCGKSCDRGVRCFSSAFRGFGSLWPHGPRGRSRTETVMADFRRLKRYRGSAPCMPDWAPRARYPFTPV